MIIETRKNGEKVAPGNAGLAAFVADLERLRRDAGQPSLRRMSQTCHYSHTALSSVLSGMRLPSQELTLAFVQACGGDEEAWRVRWEREHALLCGTGTANGHRGPTRRRPPVPAWLAAAGATLLALGIVVAALAPWRTDPPAARDVAAVDDGADPQERRCQTDAVNAATVEVTGAAGAKSRFGSLTLRYSPRCRGAWPLFVSTERVPAGATIHLETTRPADGAVTTFDYPYLVKAQVYSVFGNMLRTTKGCVSVTINLLAADGRRSLASARTRCVTLT